jgi:hypothetical protein
LERKKSAKVKRRLKAMALRLAIGFAPVARFDILLPAANDQSHQVEDFLEAQQDTSLASL